MNVIINALAAIAASTVFAMNAFANSTVVLIHNPLPGPLAQGVRVHPVPCRELADPARWRERTHATCLRGSATYTSPVDDLPWQWADYGNSNTIILVGMPRGQHKVLIEVVDPEGNVFTGQTVTFHAPGKAVRP